MLDSLVSPDVNAFYSQVLDKGISVGEAIDFSVMGAFLTAAHTPLGTIGKASPIAEVGGGSSSKTITRENPSSSSGEVSAISKGHAKLDDSADTGLGKTRTDESFVSEKYDSDTISESDIPATAPMGSRDFQLNQPKNPFYQPTRNESATINNRQYTKHSLDRMQDRGIPPSVIENAIQHGEAVPAIKNTVIYYDKINNISVVTNKKGDVVTVSYGNLIKRK